MSYEITEMKEFEMRRDMDILEISISVACVRDRKGEREGKLYDAIQRFYLTFEKNGKCCNSGAFFPRASLLNAIVQQAESPARESMGKLCHGRNCVRFYNVFLRGEKKKNSARFDNANNRAGFAIACLSTSFIVHLSYSWTSELLPYPIE